jgi:hypothetical protein
MTPHAAYYARVWVFVLLQSLAAAGAWIAADLFGSFSATAWLCVIPAAVCVALINDRAVSWINRQEKDLARERAADPAERRPSRSVQCWKK